MPNGFNIFKNIIKWILKKIKIDMISESELISYKTNFTGQSFQWIKTPRPELMGKVVACRDVIVRGRTVVAIFDDGSQCDVERVTSDLMMIHGDMQPLSKAEVESISKPIPPKVPIATADKEMIPPVTMHGDQGIITLHPPVKPNVVQSNPFEVFKSEPVSLKLDMEIAIPDIKLLRMMHNSAEDKDVFITQLSNYVQSKITSEIITQSLEKMLVVKQPVRKIKKILIEDGNN